MRTITINTITLAITFCLFLVISESAISQKYLQIERKNSAKTVKFEIGELIYYKSKGQPWNKSPLLEIDIDNNTITLENGLYLLDEITSIRSQKQMGIILYPTMTFIGYGIPALTYTTIAGLVYGFGNPFGFITGSTAIVLAGITYFGGKALLQYRHKRYRYRLIDISFGP